MYIKKRGKASKAAAAAAKGGGGLMTADDFDHRLGNYQLMEAIGKGGYGTVYRGLNIERGITVAVKRVNLQGIPHEELESIEMEIHLLQNLDHPNIVKYLDSIRSDDFLNIILEYVENGSLSSLLNKFKGNMRTGFPEQLCSHYITQVLKGLQYLHTQGVIHRDIKGANILSTKEGCLLNGTLVAMADGTTKAAELVASNDLLLGVEGEVAVVEAVQPNLPRDCVWRIDHRPDGSGDRRSYHVSDEHLLTLQCNRSPSIYLHFMGGKWRVCTTYLAPTGKVVYEATTCDVTDAEAAEGNEGDDDAAAAAGGDPLLSDAAELELLQDDGELEELDSPESQLLAQRSDGSAMSIASSAAKERPAKGWTYTYLGKGEQPVAWTPEELVLLDEVKNDFVLVGAGKNYVWPLQPSQQDAERFLNILLYRSIWGVNAGVFQQPRKRGGNDRSATAPRSMPHGTIPKPTLKALKAGEEGNGRVAVDVKWGPNCPAGKKPGAAFTLSVTLMAADTAAAARQKKHVQTGTRAELLAWARAQFALKLRSEYLLRGEMFELKAAQLAEGAVSMQLHHAPKHAWAIPAYMPLKEQAIDEQGQSGSSSSSAAAVASSTSGASVSAASAGAHAAAVRAAQEVDKENTPSVFAHIAVGEGEYDALKLGDTASVVYMLHNPLSAKAKCGDNAYGHKSRTFRNIEAAQHVLGVKVTRASGIIVTELNPIASTTGEMDSAQAKYDAVCAASITHALSYGTKRIIAFGRGARLRWQEAIKQRKASGEFSKATQARFVDGVLTAAFTVAQGGRDVLVLFSPHPCLWRKARVVTRAIAAAHGLQQLTDSRLARVTFAATPAVKVIVPSLVTNIVIRGEKEADRRYVLASGIVTHNCVKLADFGVATKLSESRKSDSVVGTPYWMAPEIIEMTGQQSSACDIWSVGCTCVELLTGKPPYFDLQQMSALFRIVHDEYPPLPSGISPALEDFLLNCFQKDPNRRIDANGLLKHPWLKKSVEVIDAQEKALVIGMALSLPIKPAAAGDESKGSYWDAGEEPAVVKANDIHADDADGELDINLRPVEDEGDPFEGFSDDDEGEGEGFVGAGTVDDQNEGEQVVSKTTLKTIRPTIMPQPQQSASAPTMAANNRSPSNVSFSLGDSGGGLSHTAPSTRKLEAFVENDDEEMEDFEELIGDDGDLEVCKIGAVTGAVAIAGQHTHSAAAPGHKDNKSIGDNLDDEDDPFDDITFEEGDEKADDVLLNRSFMRILEVLSPDSSECVVLDACERLNDLGKTHPEQVRSLMTMHGVIPIMELLEVGNAHILLAILKVVNNIVDKNHKFQQNMSLVGLIPAIIRFSGQAYPREIRMEAANFVRQFCYASDWTRKMFIACDGLPVLVSFLLEEYTQSKTLVWNAIDCIRHVFDITTSPKNDFCRLFCKFGLLEPLTRTLIAIHLDKESHDAPAFVFKIAGILHMFSQGDKVVKLHFAKPAVIESMLRVLPSVPQEPLILLLKSIRNISMDSTTLDLLEAAGAIPALVPFLDATTVSENQHQVLLTMYYLCQIKTSRQEQAALSGIIPHLQRFIREEHPLKQFAYPIIFLLAKTSWRARLELKKHQGLQFYINILTSTDVYWRNAALDCISAWLSASNDDTARVSFLLNTPSNINKLMRVFRDTDDATQFDRMLPSFRKILASSVKVNQSLGRCKEFSMEIRARLCRHTSSNNIRINLLKMVSLLFAAHPCPAQLADDVNLVPVLHSLLEDKSAVIVGSLTQKLLTQYLHAPPPTTVGDKMHENVEKAHNAC